MYKKHRMGKWASSVLVFRKDTIKKEEGIMLEVQRSGGRLCCVAVSCAQACLTLCNPLDCSPSGSSVHGIFPGKNTGVGCHSFFRGSSQPRDRTCISCIAGIFFKTILVQIPSADGPVIKQLASEKPHK